MESKDYESSFHLKEMSFWSRDVVFDELSMLHYKSNDDFGKAKDVTKQVEFKSSTIRNISD